MTCHECCVVNDLVRHDWLQGAPTCRGCRLYNRFIFAVVVFFLASVIVMLVAAAGVFIFRHMQ